MKAAKVWPPGPNKVVRSEPTWVAVDRLLVVLVQSWNFVISDAEYIPVELKLRPVKFAFPPDWARVKLWIGAFVVPAQIEAVGTVLAPMVVAVGLVTVTLIG